MEITEIVVTGKKSLTLPWEEIQVMPIGDLQLGSTGVDLDRFKKQIQWCRDQEKAGAPPVYFLGMGDYIDILSPSNRQAWKSAALYDSAKAAMDNAACKLEEEFTRLVGGTGNRWLGLLHGHHYFEHEDGTTSDTRIAKALKAPYLGTCAFVRVVFKSPTGGRAIKCTIWAHHGEGNGVMAHAPLNKLYHIMHNFEADVYLIGHQTKKPVVKVPRIYMTDRPPYRLISKNKVLAGTGGFTLGYELGSKGTSGLPEGSYSEKGMMTPVSLGSILLKIRPVRGSGDVLDRLDINVEV